MGLFDRLEGTVEECLKKSKPGFFFITLKPEFEKRFEKFMDENWKGTLTGDYINALDLGVLMKIEGEEICIPYDMIETYQKLGPY